MDTEGVAVDSNSYPSTDSWLTKIVLSLHSLKHLQKSTSSRDEPWDVSSCSICSLQEG